MGIGFGFKENLSLYPYLGLILLKFYIHNKAIIVFQFFLNNCIFLKINIREGNTNNLYVLNLELSGLTV